ncbi:MAG: hypothetical protein HYS06_11120 [Methylocystis sp.]|nr:hypothetical protein [Methylocystis sp.]
MWRAIFIAVIASFSELAHACDGQTGNVIFGDAFKDDMGGWTYGESEGLLFTPPGAKLLVEPNHKGGWARTHLNQTFTAAQGDFCVEMSFPRDAKRLDAGIGLVFLAQDYDNTWDVNVFSNGVVKLNKYVNGKWNMVWRATNNMVKPSDTDVNSIRAIVKNGLITVIVNGNTIRRVRANIPDGDLKFGFFGEYNVTSREAVPFNVHTYKVTSGE